MIIWSLSREKMGEATLLYVDGLKHKREKRFKTDVKKLTQQLADIAISLRDRADQSEIGETQYSEICGKFLFLFVLLLFFIFVSYLS